MSVGIVDLFKIIKIEHDTAEILLISQHLGKDSLARCLKISPVEEPGQPIVCGLLFQLFIQYFKLIDILTHPQMGLDSGMKFFGDKGLFQIVAGPGLKKSQDTLHVVQR